DAGRAGQHDLAPALLHLRGRLQVLGCGLRLGADDGAARAACYRRDPAGRLSRATDSLPVSRAYELRGAPLALETLGAWLLALLWVVPLAYALWTAFHPAAYFARFVPGATAAAEAFPH